MKISNALVKRAVELGLDQKHIDPASRVDSDVHSFILGKMIGGELASDEVTRLNVAAEEAQANSILEKAIAQATSGHAAQVAQLAAQNEVLTKNLAGMQDMLAKLVQNNVAVQSDSVNKAHTDIGKAAALVGAIGGDGASTHDGAAVDVRVTCVSEMFSKSCQTLDYSMSDNKHVRTTKSGSVYAPSGEGMREITTPSELDKSVSGAWFKKMIGEAYQDKGRPVPAQYKLTELDRRLNEYAVNNCKFIGGFKVDRDGETAEKWFNGKKIESEMMRKALLDDVVSGGLEAVPIEFDNAIITQAILSGELFPHVNTITTSRRRIEGASVGNVSFSNTAEGTAVTPFNTANFIAAFDTTIHPIVGSMEVGLDFLEDSPADIGGIINNRFSEGFRKKLDELIAVGSGSGEMLGLMNTSGLASVNAAGTAVAVSDLEGLMFGVPVAYRREADKSRIVYLSNDTVYRRIRSIQVGTTDQRRIYGHDYEEYITHGHPHKICELIPNTAAGFFCLNRYRCYRRQGYQVRVETAGYNLASRNSEFIIVRARYGGQLELGAAGAKCSDLPNS